MPRIMSERPQGNLLALIGAGHVVSIWHDVILFSPTSTPASPRSSRDKLPAPLNFICTSGKSSSFAASLSGRRRRLSLDGSVRVDDAEQRPWNVGIIPQTCVLAPAPSEPTQTALSPNKPVATIRRDFFRSLSVPSVPFDDPLGDTFSDTSDDPFAEPGAAFPVILDNAPLEAVEVGARERDPGDVFPVLPLLALPVRLRPGLGSEVSWKLVVVAADDPLVEAGETAAVAATALPQVKAWADAGGFTTVGPNPWRILESPQRDVADNWEKSAQKAEHVVREAHSAWRLLVATLRRPSLQRRQRVCEHAVEGWEEGHGLSDSSLLQLVARPGASSRGFGGDANFESCWRGGGCCGTEQSSGGKATSLRGAMSAAAKAATTSVVAPRGVSRRKEAKAARGGVDDAEQRDAAADILNDGGDSTEGDAAAKDDYCVRERLMGNGEEDGRECKTARQFERAGSDGSSDSGSLGRHRAVLSHNPPKALPGMKLPWAGLDAIFHSGPFMRSRSVRDGDDEHHMMRTRTHGSHGRAAGGDSHGCRGSPPSLDMGAAAAGSAVRCYGGLRGHISDRLAVQGEGWEEDVKRRSEAGHGSRLLFTLPMVRSRTDPRSLEAEQERFGLDLSRSGHHQESSRRGFGPDRRGVSPGGGAHGAASPDSPSEHAPGLTRRWSIASRISFKHLWGHSGRDVFSSSPHRGNASNRHSKHGESVHHAHGWGGLGAQQHVAGEPPGQQHDHAMHPCTSHASHSSSPSRIGRSVSYEDPAVGASSISLFLSHCTQNFGPVRCDFKSYLHGPRSTAAPHAPGAGGAPRVAARVAVPHGGHPAGGSVLRGEPVIDGFRPGEPVIDGSRPASAFLRRASVVALTPLVPRALALVTLHLASPSRLSLLNLRPSSRLPLGVVFLFPQQRKGRPQQQRVRIRPVVGCSVTAVLFSLDARMLFTAGASDGAVKFWDTRALKEPLTTLCPSTAPHSPTATPAPAQASPASLNMPLIPSPSLPLSSPPSHPHLGPSPSLHPPHTGTHGACEASPASLKMALIPLPISPPRFTPIPLPFHPIPPLPTPSSPLQPPHTGTPWRVRGITSLSQDAYGARLTASCTNARVYVVDMTAALPFKAPRKSSHPSHRSRIISPSRPSLRVYVVDMTAPLPFEAPLKSSHLSHVTPPPLPPFPSLRVYMVDMTAPLPRVSHALQGAQIDSFFVEVREPRPAEYQPHSQGLIACMQGGVVVCRCD
ncbi:unnamed protein product [Closterium sp. NIES-65]|nr:unnamed protein product [Closterium sp. NIES-65]CAI5988347.1 unnamed protein product [Closterium sp. NIES-65]